MWTLPPGQVRANTGRVRTATTNDAEQVAWLRAAMRSGKARRIRVEHHLHQAEASRAVGGRPNLVHRWETGARSPRGEMAVRYARLLRRLETS